MSEKTTVDINMVELVNLAANILDQLFFKLPKEKSKSNFKDLKQGKQFNMGTLTLQNKISPNLKMALDYSEFRGPGFNFDIFQGALRNILVQISKRFEDKADLNIMTSEQGSVLVHIPGFVETDGQLNALLMSFDLGTMESIVLRLMFVDPSQYDEVIKAQRS